MFTSRKHAATLPNDDTVLAIGGTSRGRALLTASVRLPIMLKQVFGWMKTVGGLRKLRHRGGRRPASYFFSALREDCSLLRHYISWPTPRAGSTRLHCGSA